MKKFFWFSAAFFLFFLISAGLYVLFHFRDSAPPSADSRNQDIAQLPLYGPENRTNRLPFVIAEDGTKEFRLRAEEFRWEYAKGQWMHVWGYNGQIPGPEIRVTEEDRVRIVVQNSLPQGTSVHWHGLDVPWKEDGVPGLSQDPIQPSEEFVYEFVAKPAGTRMYHSHGKSHTTVAQQLDMGLSGAFIVEPRAPQVEYDREFTLVLDEWNVGSNAVFTQPHPEYNLFTINGRVFPDTEPLTIERNEKVLIRFLNAGTSEFHPMHLHGHQFEVVARDGNALPLAAREIRNTVTVHPGETIDILITANNPGPWLLHCHHAHHAAAGMIVILNYAGFPTELHQIETPKEIIQQKTH